MRVTRLDGGRFVSPAGLWRDGEDMDRPVRLPVPVYLIETDTERVLVDTGLHPCAALDADRRYDALSMRHFDLEQETPLERQVDLDTITKVVLTHLHFDHAGGLAVLPAGPPIYLQRAEWHAGRSGEAIRRNFLQPRDYVGIEDQVILLGGEHDLTGDGSIRLLPTPGHTPGHQSVRVGERFVIGGDVTHYATGLDDLRLPTFGDDLDAQRVSARRLRAMRDDGAVVLPGHDPSFIVPGPVPIGP